MSALQKVVVWLVLPVMCAGIAAFTLHHNVQAQLKATAADVPRERQCDTGMGSSDNTYSNAAALQRFVRMLRYRTLSDLNSPVDHIRPGHHDQFEGLLQQLESDYPDVFGAVKVEKVGLGGWSRLLTWQGTDPGLKPLLLISHYDVVPVTEGTEGDWTHGPWDGTVADGFVWGRGALDIKFSVAAIMEAVARLINKGYAPARTIMITFGHDEEVGGNGGAGKIASLLAERGVEFDVVLDEGGIIFMDGIKGLVPSPVALVGTAEKLYTSVEVTVGGTGGHSSMPPSDGSDAASRIARAITRIMTHPPPADLRAPTLEFLPALAPHVAMKWVAPLLMYVDTWPLRDILGWVMARGGREIAALARTTVAVTRVTVGVADNVLPGRGTFNLNMRSHPSLDREKDVLGYVRKQLAAAGLQEGKDVWLRVTNHSHMGPQGGVTPVAGKHFQLLKHAIQEFWRDEAGQPVAVAPMLMTGGTDSKHYAGLTAGGILRFVPYRVNKTAGELGTVHATNERSRVVDFFRAICTYERIIQLLAD